MNKGSTFEEDVSPREDICVIKHGFEIPNDIDCYENFKVKMKRNEQEFREIFLSNKQDGIPDERLTDFYG